MFGEGYSLRLSFHLGHQLSPTHPPGRRTRLIEGVSSSMTRSHKSLGFLLVTLFGIWGCARGPEPTASTAAAAANDRVKTLEARSAKVEDDLKQTLAAKDTLRRKLGEAEEAQVRMQQEIDRLLSVERERDQLIVSLSSRTAERDQLTVSLRSRTSERDQLQVQFDGFRKNIRELLGQAETTMRNSQQNTTGVAVGPTLPGGQ